VRWSTGPQTTTMTTNGVSKGPRFKDTKKRKTAVIKKKRIKKKKKKELLQ
jgi:hypothetical protein